MPFQPVRMDASLVHTYYAHDTTLYRRRLDGSYKRISTVNSGRLVTTFDGERIDAAAVVWCLYHKRWPKYPLAVIDGNPHNLDLDNIFPVVGKPLRYRQQGEPGMYRHPLSDFTFRTPEECRESWNWCAKSHYQKTMAIALVNEKRDEELRQASGAVNPHLADYEKRKAERTVVLSKRLAEARAGVGKSDRPEKPEKVKGRVWLFHEGAWVSVMEPIHVSDDYRLRISAVARGAVRAEYQPDFEETFYFREDGSVVKPV